MPTAKIGVIGGSSNGLSRRWYEGGRVGIDIMRGVAGTGYQIIEATLLDLTPLV